MNVNRARKLNTVKHRKNTSDTIWMPNEFKTAMKREWNIWIWKHTRNARCLLIGAYRMYSREKTKRIPMNVHCIRPFESLHYHWQSPFPQRIYKLLLLFRIENMSKKRIIQEFCYRSNWQAKEIEWQRRFFHFSSLSGDASAPNIHRERLISEILILCAAQNSMATQ